MNLHALTAENICNIIRNNSDFIMWHRLHNMPNANCKVGIVKVEESADENLYIVFLKTYETIVCGFVLGNENYIIFCTGTYSRTTAIQVTFFCHEFYDTLNSSFMKQLSEFPRQAVCTENGFGSAKVISGLLRYVGDRDGKDVH